MNENERTFTQEELERAVAEQLAQRTRELEARMAQERALLDEKSEEAAAALAAREEAVQRAEQRAMTVRALQESGLPAELAATLPFENEADMRAGVAALERAFRAAVQSAVQERLKGDAPRAAAAPVDLDSLTDAAYYAHVLK